jgi:hypothetical protein
VTKDKKPTLKTPKPTPKPAAKPVAKRKHPTPSTADAAAAAALGNKKARPLTTKKPPTQHNNNKNDTPTRPQTHNTSPPNGSTTATIDLQELLQRVGGLERLVATTSCNGASKEDVESIIKGSNDSLLNKIQSLLADHSSAKPCQMCALLQRQLESTQMQSNTLLNAVVTRSATSSPPPMQMAHHQLGVQQQPMAGFPMAALAAALSAAGGGGGRTIGAVPASFASPTPASVLAPALTQTDSTQSPAAVDQQAQMIQQMMQMMQQNSK